MPELEKSGHRTGIREKYLKAGAKAFHDYELLELALTYALPRRDVRPLAKSLIQRFGSFGRLVDAPMEELVSFKGVTKNTAVLLKLMKDLAARYLEQEVRNEDIMNSAGKIADFARIQIGGLGSEVMMVLFLNTQNILIDYEIMSEGTTDQVNVYPAEIARKALLHNAKSIVLCHNHPGGLSTPSEDDILVTRQIRDMLRTFHIFLLDHIVVSRFDVYSLRREQEGMPVRARILDPIPHSPACAEPAGEYQP